jgi:hypothetical protein
LPSALSSKCSPSDSPTACHEGISVSVACVWVFPWLATPSVARKKNDITYLWDVSVCGLGGANFHSASFSTGSL